MVIVDIICILRGHTNIKYIMLIILKQPHANIHSRPAHGENALNASSKHKRPYSMALLSAIFFPSLMVFMRLRSSKFPSYKLNIADRYIKPTRITSPAVLRYIERDYANWFVCCVMGWEGREQNVGGDGTNK